MRRLLLLTMLCAVTALPAWATHPEEDPDLCRGHIGGQWIRHSSEPRLQMPRLSPGVVVPLVDPAQGPFYLDVRDIASEYWTFSIWLFQETNRQPGLQRGGRSLIPDTPAPGGIYCTESTTPDQLIFG